VNPGELKTVQRLRRLVDTATGAHDKMVIDEYGHLVLRLPAQGYGTTEFDMTDERRDALVKAGRGAMAQYFDKAANVAKASRRFSKGGIVSESTADRIATAILR
jgi:hypothetical protein